MSTEPPPPLTASASGPTDSASVAPVEPAPGFGSTLVGLYTAPGETFRALARRPKWLAPFLALIVVNVAFTFVWLHKADPAEVARTQMEEAGVFDRIPAERHAEIVERQARLLPIMAWLNPILFAPIVFVVLAGICVFVYRFFYASDTTLAQSLAVVCWSFLAVSLVATPLILLTLALRGEWSVDPRNVLQANPAALFDKGTIGKPLHAFLDSLDLFSAWTLFLWSAGFAAAAKRSIGSAAVGVLLLWGMYVALKVALAFVL